MELIDVNGKQLNENDILFDGKYYHKIYTNHLGEIEMFCIQQGYTTEVKQNDIKNYEYAGSFPKDVFLMGTD